ncbi:MAG: hypothetical protein ACTSWN_08800 [Promethearchaeota archaeon]
MLKDNFIYDLYIIKISGIPIIAGCTGSDYCRLHSEQHELHAGFFSAMLAFSKEAFKGTIIKLIEFDKIQLNLLINEDRDFFIVFVHPSNVNKRKVRKHLFVAENLLLEKFPDLVSGMISDGEMIEAYKDELRKKKILPSNRSLKNLWGMQKAWEDLIKNLGPSKE